VAALRRYCFCYFALADKQCMVVASSPEELGKIRCDVAIVLDRYHFSCDLVGHGIYSGGMASGESGRTATPTYN
jgi:hypothetical protein